MKAFFLQIFLATGIALPGWASSTETVTVSASSALRVAWVEKGARGDAVTELQRVFRPVFKRTLEVIYGADTPIEFVTVSSSRAASRLRYGKVDAALQFSPRLSRRLVQAGDHVLRAESATEPGRFVAFLILPETDGELRGLLANAFSVSINHFDVRRSLDDVATGTEVAGW